MQIEPNKKRANSTKESIMGHELLEVYLEVAEIRLNAI